MKKFSSISFQLFGFLGFAILIIGLLSYFSLSYNVETRNFLNLAQKDTDFLNLVKEVRYHFSFARKEEKNWLLFRNKSYLDSHEKSLARAQNILVDLKHRADVPELVEMTETLGSNLLHYATLDDVMSRLETPKQIKGFTERAKVIDDNITEEVAGITYYLLQRVGEHQKMANQHFQTYFYFLATTFIIGSVLLTGTGFFWVSRFRKRLHGLTHATQKMALGDYSPQLETSYADELGVLASNFNDMAGAIASREEKIAQITQELIQANNLLKKGTTPIHQIPKIRV